MMIAVQYDIILYTWGWSHLCTKHRVN